MAKTDPVLVRMREICLSLPETKETFTWGQPHFRVRERIFAGYGADKAGKASIGFKLEKDHAEAILDDPRFERAPYVGHAGWVSMDVSSIRDWEEVRRLVQESYRLIAPKSCYVKVGAAKPSAGASRAGSRDTRGKAKGSSGGRVSRAASSATKGRSSGGKAAVASSKGAGTKRRGANRRATSRSKATTRSAPKR